MSRDTGDVRARAYRLLSRLYLRGIGPADLPLLEEVPDLAGLLPDPFDADEAAAEHQRLLQREVLPFASVFLETDGALGGDVSAAVGRRFEAAGRSRPTSEAPDHLGRELELVAALGEGAADEVVAFLDGHLLWWLPSLTPALRRNAGPLWRTVADLTLDLVLDDRSERAGEAPPDRPPPWSLRGPPRDPLDDPTVDLREIATFLMLPARSGLYLSEADARGLGRARRLPGGFGSRARVLETVFHSAVAYDGMVDVAGGLRSLVDDVKGDLEGMVARGLPSELLRPWTSRLERTSAMLARMAEGEGPLS